MFDELRYRWALKKYLKEHRDLYRVYDETPDDPEEWGDEPRVKHAMGREILYVSQATNYFRSKYLLEQAYKHHVPTPPRRRELVAAPRLSRALSNSRSRAKAPCRYSS